VTLPKRRFAGPVTSEAKGYRHGKLVVTLLLLLAVEVVGRAPPSEYGTPSSVT
jgi:hypothetical protein